MRLARNEPEEEARREGEKDGAKIHADFKSHPYISNLARNPLMLSAICLVNYFESGQLPEDRAKLYELCVEGLLHNWDQRRGIHSEFSLSEKLRACRETALAMQAADRAEYEATRVEKIFVSALGDPRRGRQLLEHIRYRAGLLLERRPGAFAFAHLTFQEYFAALAVHEGNDSGVDIAQLIREHNDGRWREVIPLYCGLSPARDAKVVLEDLIEQPDTRKLSLVLGEAYLAAGAELARDRTLRERVLRRIAVAPHIDILRKFPREEVAPIANDLIGRIKSGIALSEAYRWLLRNLGYENIELIASRLTKWDEMNPVALCELIYFLHRSGPDSNLMEIASRSELYSAPGPDFGAGVNYGSQAEVALIGLCDRLRILPDSPGIDAAFFQILRTMSIRELGPETFRIERLLL
ncbi:MAG: hypothetical protein GY859_39735, partial [Desulfobacterales bacterium]|nr:hypothetical protein [Desulfobacterales bacterium]